MMAAPAAVAAVAEGEAVGAAVAKGTEAWCGHLRMALEETDTQLALEHCLRALRAMQQVGLIDVWSSSDVVNCWLELDPAKAELVAAALVLASRSAFSVEGYIVGASAPTWPVRQEARQHARYLGSVALALAQSGGAPCKDLQAGGREFKMARMLETDEFLHAAERLLEACPQKHIPAQDQLVIVRRKMQARLADLIKPKVINSLMKLQEGGSPSPGVAARVLGSPAKDTLKGLGDKKLEAVQTALPKFSPEGGRHLRVQDLLSLGQGVEASPCQKFHDMAKELSRLLCSRPPSPQPAAPPMRPRLILGSWNMRASSIYHTVLGQVALGSGTFWEKLSNLARVAQQEGMRLVALQVG